MGRFSNLKFVGVGPLRQFSCQVSGETGMSLARGACSPHWGVLSPGRLSGVHCPQDYWPQYYCHHDIYVAGCAVPSKKDEKKLDKGVGIRVAILLLFSLLSLSNQNQPISYLRGVCCQAHISDSYLPCGYAAALRMFHVST